MSNTTDHAIAMATAARFVRGTAKAQVAYDLKALMVFGDEEFGEGELQLHCPREWKRLQFCKAKAREWSEKASHLKNEGSES